MRDRFTKISALTVRNLKEILRDPLSLIFMLALPLFMEILFYFLFHGMTSQFEMKYFAPGIVVFSQTFLTLFAGLLISMDRSTAFLTRLYVSGAKSFDFIAGYLLALLPIAVIQSILFFLVGGMIDPSIFSASMILSALMSLIPSLFFISLGILFGSVCNEKSVGGISSIAITGQSLLSGMWFPVDSMKSGFLTAMKCLPFKNATVVVQNVLTGISDPFADLWSPLLILLGYVVVIFTAAVLVFGSKMKAK